MMYLIGLVFSVTRFVLYKVRKATFKLLTIVVKLEVDQIRFAILVRNRAVAVRADRIESAIRVLTVRERAQILTRGGHGETPPAKEMDHGRIASSPAKNKSETIKSR